MICNLNLKSSLALWTLGKGARLTQQEEAPSALLLAALG